MTTLTKRRWPAAHARLRRLLLIALVSPACLAAHPACAGSPGDDRIVIASWNVENLFDPADDPAKPEDDEFTPRGWAGWTPARYALKLAHLAEVIAAMRPDILCLAEVENRQVLLDLSRVLREKHAWDLPAIVHRDGPDTRGIDVAILARWAP